MLDPYVGSYPTLAPAMSKRVQMMQLGAAECARRTGLTVRALRIYERQALIEPKRSGKGWRLYGEKELQRLHVIVTLKAMGMTLAQIHSLLHQSPPSLEGVLRLQLQALQARKAEAELALGIVQTSLTRVRAGAPPSLEELCDLTRSMEMKDFHPTDLLPSTRKLMNEYLSPDEERSLMTWIAARPPDALRALHEGAPAVRGVLSSLEELRAKSVAPSAPEVQGLMAQRHQISIRYGVLKHRAALFEWNPAVAVKMAEISERTMSRALSSAAATEGHGLSEYMVEAQSASPWNKEVIAIAAEAGKLAAQGVDPSSATALELANRLTQICFANSLGDPLIYARATAATQFRASADVNKRVMGAWAYLANALQARSAGSSGQGER